MQSFANHDVSLDDLLRDPAARGVVRVANLDLRLDPDERWAFADDKSAEINQHWQSRLADNPSFFNGAVMMLTDCRYDDGVLTGSFLRTDFKSFIYWRDSGCPSAGVRDSFGSGLVWSADGGLMLVRQSAGQVNTGLTYPPGGFIDARDVTHDGRIDIVGSVIRELGEETGLSPSDLRQDTGFIVTVCGPQISVGVSFQSSLDAIQLRNRVMAYVAAETDPELEDVVVLKSPELGDGGAFAEFSEVLVQHVLTGSRKTL